MGFITLPPLVVFILPSSSSSLSPSGDGTAAATAARGSRARPERVEKGGEDASGVESAAMGLGSVDRGYLLPRNQTRLIKAQTNRFSHPVNPAQPTNKG